MMTGFKRKASLMVGVIVVAGFVLAGCGSFAGGVVPGTVSSAGSGELVVVNESSVYLTDVYFSLTSASTWGPERLGTGNVLAPGEQMSWMVPAGLYDLKVVFNIGGEHFDHLEVVTISADGLLERRFDDRTSISDD